MSTAGNNRLSWIETGDSLKPVILFLHGFLGRGAEWWPVMKSLAPDYRCVAVDLPGHGDSTGLQFPQRYTLGGASDGLIDLLGFLDVDQCIIVGYSMGGRLALYFTLCFPERVNKLIIESASPGLQTPVERAERIRNDEVRARQLEAGDMVTFLRDWYDQPLFASLHRTAGLVDRLKSSKKHNDSFELARSLRAMATGQQTSLWERFFTLRVSTLYITGALDVKYTGIARRMDQMNPSVHTTVIPGAGHNVHAELPTVYLQHLIDFISNYNV